MKNKILFSCTFLLCSLLQLPGSLKAQVGRSAATKAIHVAVPAGDSVYHPTFVRQAVYADISAPLRSMPQRRPVKGEGEKEVKNNYNPKYAIYGHHPFLLPEDPVWQKQDGTYLPQSSNLVQNFDGITNLSGVYPPDTQGDVSADKYVQVVNSNFAVYSKTGSVLLGPSALATIWTGIPSPWNGTSNGDPVVLYDQAAQRWIITQFSLVTGNFAELVAVSQTSDPTGSWYRYVFQFGTLMPDYPKFGVWPDGYYMSANQFLPLGGGNYSWQGVGAVVLDRVKMLSGDPTASMQYVNLGAAANPWAMLPSDWDGTNTPLTGEPNYFTFYDNWSNASAQYLKVWSFTTDWSNPANTTFAQSYSLTTAAFNATLCGNANGACIPQPGTAVQLQSLSDRLMYRVQYRNFGSYQVMLTNHTVNTNGSGQAGIRWYEMRNTGSGWGIYQQGTYAPDASHRWVGSVAMNAQGDIALGYTVSDGTSIYPSIRYTGRRASDPLGTMTVTEQSVIAGSGSQTGSVGRWGDYSMMSVDPTDDLTFWFTTEYIQTTGGANWKTRIASFKFSNVPAAITTAASGITTVSATLNGTVNPNGLASTYHFEWGTSNAYGSSTAGTSAGSGSSALSVNAGISSLSPGITYHYRLVGVNSDGTTNGNDITFIPGGAVLTTTAATSVSTTTASSGGNISTDGGAAITARGVCWGTSPNPATAGSHTTDGTGSGSFTSSITGLSGGTSYHLRAYATNATGTFYGNDVPFSTTCGTSDLPLSESFSGYSIPLCWSQVDHQGNSELWQCGLIPNISPSPALTGNYAFLNSAGFGANSQNADLVTPTIDLSMYSNVYLKFNHYFRYVAGSSATLSYSINNGSTWTQIQQWTSTTSNPAAFNQVISAVGGQSQVKFKWNYTGTNGYYWAIDDVRISVSGLWLGGASGNPGDWNTAVNWDGSTVPIASTNIFIPARISMPVVNATGATCNNIVFGSGGTLTIDPSMDLTVHGSITLNGANIMILGNSSGTGSLIDNGIIGTGTATVQRFMTGNWTSGNPVPTTTWHAVSAPVSNPSNSLFNGSLMDKWNEAAQTWDALSLPYENMPVGKGYIVAPVSGGIIATFSGTLNTGNTTIGSLSKTGSSTYSGYNLIGNPFPSAIQWNTGINVGSNVANYAWVWNGSAYILMDRTLGTGIIPAEQGFFVQVTTDPGSVTIPNTNRVHSAQAYYKSSVNDLLTLRMDGNGFWDQTQIRIQAGSSDVYNSDYDGRKMMGSEAAPQLYSFKQDNQLSLISLPSLNVSPVILLGFKPGAAGNFTITASGLESFASATNVYLEDLLTGRTQDLKSNPVYVFEAAEGESENRFNLHFAALGISENESGANIKIYSSGNVIYVNILSQMSGNISVFNLLGSEIARMPIRSNSLNKLSLNIPQGYYLVKVTGDTGTAEGKVLIR